MKYLNLINVLYTKLLQDVKSFVVICRNIHIIINIHGIIRIYISTISPAKTADIVPDSAAYLSS